MFKIVLNTQGKKQENFSKKTDLTCDVSLHTVNCSQLWRRECAMCKCVSVSVLFDSEFPVFCICFLLSFASVLLLLKWLWYNIYMQFCRLLVWGEKSVDRRKLCLSGYFLCWCFLFYSYFIFQTDWIILRGVGTYTDLH